jgi:hypothetical protein
MTPVVNGLEEAYQERVDFRILDANKGVGRSAFGFYRLPGHPSYVILNPDGEVLWQAAGTQSESSLDDAIQASLQAGQGR